MPRLCTVCTHPRWQEIDVTLMVHAEGLRTVAHRYTLTHWPLMRYESDRLRSSPEFSKGLIAMLSADNLLDKLGDLDERTVKLLDAAETSDDPRAPLGAMPESSGTSRPSLASAR